MKSHKPYPEEFKQEAIKLVTEQGMHQSQVARDLGVGLDTLRRWVRGAQPATAKTLDVPSTSGELARLQRENDQLRMERDILKKAIGIFSRMPQ